MSNTKDKNNRTSKKKHINSLEKGENRSRTQSECFFCKNPWENPVYKLDLKLDSHSRGPSKSVPCINTIIWESNHHNHHTIYNHMATAVSYLKITILYAQCADQHLIRSNNYIITYDYFSYNLHMLE